jgi:putative Mg2+ transporter-C (MgtC) family protein
MSTSLTWPEIALRLCLTAIAGAIVGCDRGEHGRPAGLRTNLLVCLAASVAMIQTNLLLATVGKAGDSFVTLDLMRLPLGILTGMGFIGGGAILKKGDIVLGVTTAATLWFVTVLGLCFGGGQLGLGVVALVIGMVVLRGLKPLETSLDLDRRARLRIEGSGGEAAGDEILAELIARGFRVKTPGIRLEKEGRGWMFSCEVRWRARPEDPSPPPIVEELYRREDVTRLEWRPLGQPGERPKWRPTARPGRSRQKASS